jgi:signal transduction histidine kinase
MRFTLLVGALLLAVGAATWSGWRALGTVDDALRSVVDRDMRRLLAIQYAGRAFRSMAVYELKYIASEDASERAVAGAEIDRRSKDLEKQLDLYATVMESDDAATLAKIRDLRAGWLESDRAMRRAAADDLPSARRQAKEHDVGTSSWEAEIHRLVEANEHRLTTQAQRAHGIAVRARVVLVLVSTVATLCALGLGAIIVLGIRRNIRSVTDVNSNLERLVQARTASLAEREQALRSALAQLTQEARAREHAEVELRHAQKLESVGRLAGGIAHNLNTPLQFVRDSIHFVREATDDLFRACEPHRRLREAASAAFPGLAADALAAEEEADVDYLARQIPASINRALDGLARIAALVQGMTDFARQESEDAVPSDLNEALRTTLAVARSQCEEVAVVRTDFGELPPVVCHIGALQNVFLNLIVNAADAIGERTRGTDSKGVIRVQTRQQGTSVVIGVSDDGTGIPHAIHDKIFEPFFTTKDVGHGNGQGLAVARSLVEKHGGEITFDTRVGEGTTFFIRLPISPRADSSRDGPGDPGRPSV